MIKKIGLVGLLVWISLGIGTSLARNAKLSALPELATTPVASDEIYINDDGVSKKVTFTNLVDHKIDSVGDCTEGDCLDGTSDGGSYIQFYPVETVPYAAGRLYYDSDDNTFKLFNGESDIALNLGEEQWIFCRNNTGVDIVNGEVVYISGAIGQQPTIALADADVMASSLVVGIATHTIEHNTNGYVTTSGIVRDLDTDGSPVGETWLDGDRLWLSTTAGKMTNIEPVAPAFAVVVGFVRHSHTTLGNIYAFISARIKNGTIGTPISGNLVNCTGYTADDVEMAELGTATYDDLQDSQNNTQSSGKISGGAFDLLNGTGTLDVAAGTGKIRATNSATAEVMDFDWPQNATVALIDNTTNYIYVDYNSGTPVVAATTTKTNVDNRTKILLGKVYREGTVLHEVEAGMVLTELAKRVLTYLNGLNGEIVRFTGLTVSETGDLNIAVSSGAGSAGLTPLTWSAIDTSGVHDFRYWYNNGTWQESTASVISNTQYNNYGVGLATIQPNQYARMEVYEHFEGDLHVVYGIGTYTLAEALAAPQLANLPDIVKDFSLYIGGIIIKRDEASTFTDVLTPWDNTISGGVVTSHTSLSDLNTASHTHVSSTIAGYLDPTSSVQTQLDAKEDNDSTYTGLDVNGATAVFSHTWTPAIDGTISAVRSGLAGTTLWDSAYDMDPDGHIIGLLGTAQASGTGVGTLGLCIGVEGAIYPVNPNTTINKAIGVAVNLFNGSATVNNFYGFYLGDTPKDATNMYSLYSAEIEAFFFHSGSGAFYGANKAGGSSNTLELNPTIVAMDGSDTIRGLNININGTPTHTGTGNFVVGLEIDGLQAQHALAYEAAMYIGTEWDYHLLSEGDFNFAPSFDFDDYFVFKTVSNEPTIATSGTSNLILAPDSGVTEVTGDLVVSGDIGMTSLDVTTIQANTASVTVGGTSDDVHIALDGAPDADDSYSGTTIRGKNAGETTAQWDLVYFDTTDSEWKIADANVSGEWPAWGMGVAVGADGAELVILQKGVVRNDAWNWTVGAALYLDETTPGGMTEAAPSTTGDCIQPVGLALTADVVLIDINAMYGYGESS